MERIYVPAVVAFVLALVLTGCGGGIVDAGPVQGDDAPTTRTNDDEPSRDGDGQPGDDVEPGGEAAEPDPESGQTDGSSEGTDGVDSDAAEADATTAIRLYFLAPGGDTTGRAGPFLVAVEREVSSTPRIALATLRALVDGPSGADGSRIDGLASEVPDRTLVLGVTIDDGLATVDLSREFEAGGGSFSMRSRLAQVVYTVTQFPTVDEVEFHLDGQPVTVFSNEGLVFDRPMSRADHVDLLPTVFVDQPAAGAEIRSGARVTGMATVFEATFQYRLRAADGTTLDEGFAMTDNGTGWGSFDFSLRFGVDEAQEGTLTVWEFSAEDGSVQAERVTPVVLRP